MNVRRSLLGCVSLCGMIAASACSSSPVSSTRTMEADAAFSGLGYGSGHDQQAGTAAISEEIAIEADSGVVVNRGGVGYGSGH
ncbi:MAG TPA: hypothetical protein VGC13_10615 [Longimicrobium sp.]|uniref:hypothetical protein n=1 Tax=Longimicrobium sp. TaxID=2029185 RepID=UPI002EDBAD6D